MARARGDVLERISKSPPPARLLSALRIAVSIACGLVLALVVPERITHALIVQKFALMAAPLSGALYPSTHRDEITIVLIDDSTVPVDAWPARYGVYSNLLRQIGSHAPKAIFVDVVLAHKGDDEIDDLKAALDELTHPAMGRGPIKLFLAAAGEGSQAPKISKDLDGLPNVTPVAVNYDPGEIDQVAWTYPLASSVEPMRHTIPNTEVVAARDEHAHANTAGSAEATVPRTPSAAFAIYEAVRRRDANDPMAGRDAGEAAVMSMTWGLSPAARGMGWNERLTEDEKKEAIDARLHPNTIGLTARKLKHWIWTADWLNFAALYQSGPTPLGQRLSEFIKWPTQWPQALGGDGSLRYCSSTGEPASIRVFLRAEIHAAFPGVGMPMCAFHRALAASSIDEMTGAELKEAFSDRIVMIGTALSDATDMVISPIHAQIPGVFLHAMALDNLLKSHGRFIEERKAEFKLPDIELALIGMVGVLLLHRFKAKYESRWRRLVEGAYAVGRSTAAPRTVNRAWGALRVSVSMRGTSRGKRKRGRSWLPGQSRVVERGLAAYERTYVPVPKWRQALFYVSWKLGTALLGIALCMWLLWLGETLLYLSYWAIAHIVLCTVAAEWLEWGNHIVDWFFDQREAES